MTDRMKNKIKSFLTVTIICFCAGTLGLAAAFWLYVQSLSENSGLFSVSASEPDRAKRTNFAILGVDDDGTRTDTIMVGSYNRDTGTVDIISIPRDTYVEMPEERLQVLRAEGRWVPTDGVMKINAVHSLAGKEHGVAFAVAQLEELLGIQIDYSAKLDLAAFRHLVDAIGGVVFDVPQRMYYRDPEQGLYIDLQPGFQTLNGEQAEQLVRYRKADNHNPISSGYAEGDLQRVKVQQAFVKEFISQAMAKKNLLSATGALITTIFQYVETDFGIADIPKYLGDLKNFSSDNINLMTMPGDAAYIRGQSYVMIREPDMRDMLEVIFGEEEIKYENSFGKNIMVLNGGQTRGKAGEIRNILEEAGYNVSSIGDYMGFQQESTRIFVRKRGQGEDLLAFFDYAEIIIEPQTDCDIRVVIGLSE